MFWTFAGIFGICEFGQQFSRSFDEINDIYDRLAWYKFPNDVQHALPTLMVVAQKPIELHVFGSISCSRITLKSVSTKS